MPAPLLEIDDLHVSTVDEGTDPAIEILTGVSLVVHEGEIHALIGPRGSGKSTLACTIAGSPDYQVDRGSVRFRGDDITSWGPDLRAGAGIFLAFQHPPAIAGVSPSSFLRRSRSARTGLDVGGLEFQRSLTAWMRRLQIDESSDTRPLDDGRAPNERRLAELLQMALLEPDLAVLDETDAGLDSDDVRLVANGVLEVRKARPKLGTLAITHYQRLLDHLEPDVVHVMIDGNIVATGGPDLATEFEAEGYENDR